VEKRESDRVTRRAGMAQPRPFPGPSFPGHPGHQRPGSNVDRGGARGPRWRDSRV